MKFKHTLGCGLAALALAGSASASVLFSEGFENLAASGWTLTNKSSPAGDDWAQGIPEIFTAQAGSDGSYAAASYLSAANGEGSLSNWLISPLITVNGNSKLDFFARGDFLDGFFDTIKVYVSANGSSDPADFTLIGSLTAPTDGWQEFSFLTSYVGTGRYAFEYAGDAAQANFAGIDTVNVSLPEPLSLALVGVALAGVGASRRRAAKA